MQSHQILSFLSNSNGDQPTSELKPIPLVEERILTQLKEAQERQVPEEDRMAHGLEVRAKRHYAASLMLLKLYNDGAKLVNSGAAYLTSPTASTDLYTANRSRLLNIYYSLDANIADGLLPLAFILKVALDHSPIDYIFKCKRSSNSNIDMTNYKDCVFLPNESKISEYGIAALVVLYIINNPIKFRHWYTPSELADMEKARDYYFSTMGIRNNIDKAMDAFYSVYSRDFSEPQSLTALISNAIPSELYANGFVDAVKPSIFPELAVEIVGIKNSTVVEALIKVLFIKEQLKVIKYSNSYGLALRRNHPGTFDLTNKLIECSKSKSAMDACHHAILDEVCKKLIERLEAKLKVFQGTPSAQQFPGTWEEFTKSFSDLKKNYSPMELTAVLTATAHLLKLEGDLDHISKGVYVPWSILKPK